MNPFFRSIAVAALGACAPVALAQPLPVAPVHNVQDRYFGVTVDDPYRYMENLKDPQVANWIRAHADHARKVLDSIPGRADILKQFRAMDAATPARLSDVQRLPDGSVFYEKRSAKDDQFKLYRRTGFAGRETLVVDPEQWRKATGKPHAINYYAPSPDGRRVAVGISESGSEAASIYLFDARTGQRIEGPIDRAKYGGVSWVPDGSAFFYNRLRKLPPDTPPAELEQYTQVFLHKLGTDADADPAVVKQGTPGISLAPIDAPFVVVTPGSRWAVAVLYAGTQREITMYAAPLDDAIAGGAPWRRLVTPDDKVTSFSVFGDDVYLLTHRDSPRFSVLRASLAGNGIADAKTVVPPSQLVVEEIGAARDALYVSSRDGAVQRVSRVPHGGAPSEVRLPFSGSASLVSADPRIDGVLIEMTGWTRAWQLYQARGGTVTNTGLYPVGKYDQPRDLVTDEVKVPSWDGAMVPLSIVHKKGVALDGRNPTLLYGYGAYGITESAIFTPTRLAWLDRGGVYAVANVRGSAVYGEDWYKAGYKATKPNTWKDFIACAQWLIDHKYTSTLEARNPRRQCRRNTRRPRDDRAARSVRRGRVGRRRGGHGAPGDDDERIFEHRRVRHRREGGRVPRAARDEPLRAREAGHRVSGRSVHARLQRSARRRVGVGEDGGAGDGGDDERQAGAARRRLRGRARHRQHEGAGLPRVRRYLRLSVLADRHTGLRAAVTDGRRRERRARRGERRE